MGSLFLDRSHNRLKRLWIVSGELGEDLAIEGDASFLEPVDQPAVAHSFEPRTRVHARGPERAHGALFQPPVAVGVLSRLKNGGLRQLELAFAPPHVALCLG